MDCIAFQGQGCPQPYVEDCNKPFSELPPPLDMAPPPQVYEYEQTYRAYPGWSDAGPPPPYWQYSDVQETVTKTQIPPWWKPYGDENPYMYPGYPGVPTAVPPPPPQAPPYDVGIVVTNPAVFFTTAAVTIEDGEVYYSPGVVTVVVTSTAVLSNDNGLYNPYETVEPLTQPTIPIDPNAPVPTDGTLGPDMGAPQAPGALPLGSPTGALLPGAAPPVPNVVTAPGPSLAGPTTPPLVPMAPAPTPAPPASVPVAAVPVSAAPPAAIPVSAGAPVPIASAPFIPPPGGLISKQERHTLTIPDETIAVPGGQTITIPGSIVTVTGPWPPPGAAGYTPTPAEWTYATPSTGTPGTTGAPVGPPARKVSGWTAINPEAPFTPGTEAPAASTAFFEPPKNNSPGIPLFEAPNRCGPNSPRCDDGAYCDPQPLCDSGSTCPGVCLPFYGGKFSQPDATRNQIWDKVMSEGIYKIKVSVTKVLQVPKEATTLLRVVKKA